jgi:hypothetical protein
MGSPQEYISFIGISHILPTKCEWEMKSSIIKGAIRMMSDKEALRQHFYKTEKCQYEEKCKSKDVCDHAHFLEEYRIPICLFFNFCEQKDCKHFHPQRDLKEFFPIPSFKYSTYESLKKREDVMKNLLPLYERNPLAIPSKSLNMKEKTKLCEFVKEKRMCKRGGCSFAHSLDELVVNQEFNTLEEKKRFVEITSGKKVEDFYLRPSYKNSSDRKREYDEIKFIKMMQAEENGEEYLDEEEEEVEEDQIDEDQIDEVLGEIEMEEHKNQFLQEIENMENMEMEEFDDGIVVDTFYY